MIPGIAQDGRSRGSPLTDLGTVASKRGSVAPPDPPSITSVTPDHCPTNEPTPVVLAGTGFTGATAVTIHDATHGGSDVALQDITVVSDIEIQAGYSGGIEDAQVTTITVTGPGGSDDIPFTLDTP